MVVDDMIRELMAMVNDRVKSLNTTLVENETFAKQSIIWLMEFEGLTDLVRLARKIGCRWYIDFIYTDADETKLKSLDVKDY